MIHEYALIKNVQLFVIINRQLNDLPCVSMRIFPYLCYIKTRE